MKKTILVLALTVAMLAAMSGIAYAGNTEGTFDSTIAGGAKIHSGYAAGNNDCKACHDVHGNTNYKLFIANSTSAGCTLCHITTTVGTAVYGSDPDVHRIAVDTTTPDTAADELDRSGSASQLDCMDCHDAAPHGVGYTAGTDYPLTKGFAIATESVEFCLQCHDENDGRVPAGTTRTDLGTHVMIAQGGAYTENGATNAVHANALSTSALCTSCHTNGSKTDFPHTGNFKLLDDAAGADLLDVTCLRCHSAGVGVTY